MKIYVKNMICESCKVVVQDILEELNLTPVKVELGEVEIKETISPEMKRIFDSKIRKVGLELLEKKNEMLIDKIRIAIVDYVYNTDERPNINFSTMLSRALGYSYTYLSNFFSEVEDTTIEQYIISLKIERIKELIGFDEYTFSEIAHMLHYSSVAHLSAQFKKVTGLKPSHFRAMNEKKRIAVQRI